MADMKQETVFHLTLFFCSFMQGSEPVYSYSVITVESSPAISWIHHRMPVSFLCCTSAPYMECTSSHILMLLIKIVHVLWITVKILKFGTPQTIAIIVLK